MSETRPLDVIHRQVLFDVAENAKDIASFAGLSPISDEVAEMERRDSGKRLAEIVRLQPALEDHADFLAAVFVGIQRLAAQERGVDAPDESWVLAHESLKTMLHTACTSMMSIYVDLGIVHLAPEWKQPSEQEAPGE